VHNFTAIHVLHTANVALVGLQGNTAQANDFVSHPKQRAFCVSSKLFARSSAASI